MKRRMLISAVGLVCAVVFGLVTNVCAADAVIDTSKNAQQHTIVRMHYISGLNPAELTVTPGTTVVWVNDARTTVEIQFLDKQVTVACKSPVHFIVDESGAFVSDKVPQGSVASLCFIEPGEYEYIMFKTIPGGEGSGTYRGTKHLFQGKVIVVAAQ